jgi:hypothetical protein
VAPIVTADKQLDSATFTINGKDYQMRREGERFVLKDPENPLAVVDSTIRWEVQVVDRDGLSLDRPLSGVLQVRPDHEPNVGIATVTRIVWPEAEPTIQYRAVDDYALGRLVARVSVKRPSDEEAGELRPVTPEKVIEVASADGRKAELQGTFNLDIRALEVAAGDRILVSVEAVDYRGAAPGKSMSAAPIVLEVSDREGVIDAIYKLDESIDKKLAQIIDAQLGM